MKKLKIEDSEEPNDTAEEIPLDGKNPSPDISKPRYLEQMFISRTSSTLRDCIKIADIISREP